MNTDKLIDLLKKNSNEKKRYIFSEKNKISFSVLNKTVSQIKERDDNSIIIDLINNNKRSQRNIDARDFDLVTKNINNMNSLIELKNVPFYDSFPETKKINREIKLDSEIMNFCRDDLSELIPKVLDVHNNILDISQVKSIESNFNFSITKRTFISNENIFEDVELSFDLSSEASAHYNSDSSHHIYRDFFKMNDLDLDKYAKDLKLKIDLEKGPVIDDNVNSKDYDLIFPPECIDELIYTFLLEQIDIEQYTKKDSFIWSDIELDHKLNLIEDPQIDYSFYSRIYDSDFVLTTKKDLIKNGKVTGYLANQNGAYKYNGVPTGNALSDLVTNIYLKPGTKSYLDLISNTKKGLIIFGLLGLHTTNSTEGSLNVTSYSAAELIDGKVMRILKNIPINEKFVKLFKNVELSKETFILGHTNYPYIFCRRN